MTKDEQEIVNVHRAKPLFGKYGDIELSTVLRMLLFKISVITGWKLPDDEIYMTVLNDQLTKKIREDYTSLNESEVEYAFRKYGTMVKDWGKVFNLSLLDQVLIPYYNSRSDILNFITRLPVNEKQLTYNPQSDWKLVIEENYQQFLSGSYKVELWPWEMYSEFVKEKMMEADVYKDWLKAAYIKLISVTPENNEQERRHHDIRSQGKAHHAVIELAKRLAVELLFKTAQAKKITNLFYVKSEK